MPEDQSGGITGLPSEEHLREHLKKKAQKNLNSNERSKCCNAPLDMTPLGQVCSACRTHNHEPEYR